MIETRAAINSPSNLIEARAYTFAKFILIIGVILSVISVTANILVVNYKLAVIQTFLTLLLAAGLAVLLTKKYNDIVYYLLAYSLVVLNFFMALNAKYPSYFIIGSIHTVMIFNVLGRRKGLPPVLIINFTLLAVYFFKYHDNLDVLMSGTTVNVIIFPLIVFIASYYSLVTREQCEQALVDANRELDRLSNIDGLTQLSNRRHFDTMMDHEWSRHQRKGLPLSVILCDIDHFKKYNDSAGHQAGDICLQKVAAAIRQSAGRSHDVVARYGGEEFVVLLPETDSAGAATVAEAIVGNLAEMKLAHPALDGRYITLSIGVCTTIPKREGTPRALVERADQGLYASKANGRDRITVVDHPSHGGGDGPTAAA